MAVAYVESVTTTARTSGTSKSVTLDAIPSNGQVILLHFFVNAGATVNTPSGFTLLGSQADEPNSAKLVVFRRVAASEASATYTVTTTTTVDLLLLAASVWSGVDNTTPEDATTTFTNTYSGSDNLAPAITSATANSVHVACVCCGEDSTQQSPAGYTTIEYTNGGAGQIVYKAIPSASTNTGTVNVIDSSTSYPAGASVLLKEAGGAPAFIAGRPVFVQQAVHRASTH